MRASAPSSPSGLPPLRDELILHPGPAGWDGSPSWTLEDPLRGQFFRIGWLEKTLLSRWSLGSVEQIVAETHQALPLTITAEDVRAFSQFLLANSLTQARGDEALNLLGRLQARERMSWWRYLLTHYLFLRIPLLHPDRFLRATLPWVGLFFRPTFWGLTLAAAVVGLLLASRQWETFKHTFLHFFTLEGALLAAVTLMATKFLHELGHAYTCRRFGASVSTIGVAFLVLMPVLYTDTSASWTLPRRRQRMLIGAAGMLTELAVAAWATLAWSFLPDGMGRSAAFMLATTTWVMTLAINLSPLMRFDGYFLLSDALGMPNLQPRGFAVGRWQLREWLFGLGDPLPEPLPRWLRRTLVGYAFATWIYRVFLFTGIALLVYHMTFKLLGMALFVVEIGYFVVLPVFKELREWLRRRKDYHMNRHVIATMTVGVLLLLALVVPWQRTVYAPALLRAERQGSLYMPLPAMVAHIDVRAGQRVEKGQVLMTLLADGVQHQSRQLERQIVTLGWQQDYQLFNRETAQDHQRVRQERNAALQRQETLRQQMTGLTVRAPFSGVVADMAFPLASGEWLPQGEWLATVTGEQGGTVEALVSEQDWPRLRTGDSGRFFSRDIAQPPLNGVIVDIERTALRDLRPTPELSSLYGGDIATLREAQNRLSPEQAVYRVVLRLSPDSPAPSQVVIGRVALTGESRSLLGRLWLRVSAVAIRELSF